jgi:hypothetical protein
MEWWCEFCGRSGPYEGDFKYESLRPESHDVTYIIEECKQQSLTTNIVFCLDTSNSWSATEEVKRDEPIC